VQLIVTDLSGVVHELAAEEGLSVMKIITNAGVPDLLATCGGACSCATCHVHVDAEWLHLCGSVSETENDLLDCSDHRDPTSRLSCQIRLGADLDGMKVTIARPD
jgi:2Fe-2S ferredoxin